MEPKPLDIFKSELKADFQQMLEKVAPVSEPKSDPEPKPDPVPVPGWITTLNEAVTGWEEPKIGTAILRQEAGYTAVPLNRYQIADMKMGGLASIEQPLNNIWPDLRIGSIAIGAGVGLVAGEVIDGLVPQRNNSGKINVVNVVVKGGAILALTKFGPRFMTGTGTIIAVGILGAQLLATVLPFDRWIAWIVRQIRRVLPAKLGQNPVTQTQIPAGMESPVSTNSSVRQSQARHDIYASIFG